MIFITAKKRKMSARRGVLTFEWLLISTLLVIGIVGGLAVLRDAVSAKFVMLGGAVGKLDMSYDVPRQDFTTHDGVTVSVPEQKFTGGTFDVSLQFPADGN